MGKVKLGGRAVRDDVSYGQSKIIPDHYRVTVAYYVVVTLLGSVSLFVTGNCAGADSPPRKQSYVISRNVNLTLVPVTVRNHRGEFVSDLDQADFRVYEDGKPQTITSFRHEDIPITAGLVVDHSGSMRPKRNDVMSGAAAFVRASNPEDQDFVVNFSTTPVLGLPVNTPFSSSVERLQAALSGTVDTGETALYDALVVALQHFEQDAARRKVLLVISDGGDNASRHDLSQVLQLALSANTIIYAIGLFDDDSYDQNPKILRRLAKETGGESYFPASTDKVVSVCQQIAADIRHQYQLAYTPADNDESKYHKIRVSVNARNRGRLSVRSRTGYFFASQTPAASSVPHGRSE